MEIKVKHYDTEYVGTLEYGVFEFECNHHIVKEEPCCSFFDTINGVVECGCGGIDKYYCDRDGCDEYIDYSEAFGF